MSRRFDAIIIGAGQAGPPLAGRLTASGMTVALVERSLIGGTCVNTGCTPTKTLVASARMAYVARRASDYGVVLGDRVGVDIARVKARADGVVSAVRSSIETRLARMDRCTVFRGHAKFESPNAVRVGEECFISERIFVNVGGRAVVPQLPGVEGVSYFTNESLLALDILPRHLVIVGGSYLGLEFAQMYRRFGSEVTVVEKQSRLLLQEDEDVSAAVQDVLERETIAVRLGATCISLSSCEAGVVVHVDCSEGDREVVGSHVLFAVGRRPNTDDLGLDRAGVATDSRGYIVVDDELRTSVPGIWALGECNGRGAFTHTAYNDFEIAAANLLDGEHRRVSDRIPCYALYIDPPLGRAGVTEAGARESGRPFLVGTYPMSRVRRAIERGETQGFMKVVVDAETKRIIGSTILGTEGDEVIHGILYTMHAGVPYSTLRRSVGIHPTVSELIPIMLGELGAETQAPGSAEPARRVENEPIVATRTDVELQRDVQNELNWEPTVNEAHIGVAAKDGIVTLAGFVSSFVEKHEAERAAKRVDGVKAVVNEIEVKLPISSRRTDEDLARAAVAAIQSNVLVPADRIKVTVSKGWIRLEGDVKWQFQKSAAEWSVRFLHGVAGVSNFITLESDVAATEVKAKIEGALRRSAGMDTRRITVEVEDGTVRLHGAVRSWIAWEVAEHAAWSAPGVREVENHLAVVP